MNASNSDNVIGTSNLLHIKVQDNSTFNTIIGFQEITDTKSIVIIDDKITDEKIYVKKFHLTKFSRNN